MFVRFGCPKSEDLKAEEVDPIVEIRRLAPAKLNLGLRIVGRRPDGLHRLESLFWPISLVDELILRPATAPSSLFSWHPDAYRKSELPTSGSNTVDRVLSLTAADPDLRYRAEVIKRIPIGSGLGGGSSDAGALLRWMVAEKKLSAERVKAIAAIIGADVSFFLESVPSWVTGVGEVVSPLQCEKDLRERLFFLVVIPNTGCSTKEVFAEFHRSQREFSAPRRSPGPRLSGRDLRGYLAETGNDLREAILTIAPALGPVLQALRSTGGIYTDFTGTGSTCFSVFDDEELCREATQGLQKFCRNHLCNSFVAKSYIDATSHR